MTMPKIVPKMLQLEHSKVCLALSTHVSSPTDLDILTSNALW